MALTQQNLLAAGTARAHGAGELVLLDCLPNEVQSGAELARHLRSRRSLQGLSPPTCAEPGQKAIGWIPQYVEQRVVARPRQPRHPRAQGLPTLAAALAGGGPGRRKEARLMLARGPPRCTLVNALPRGCGWRSNGLGTWPLRSEPRPRVPPPGADDAAESFVFTVPCDRHRPALLRELETYLADALPQAETAEEDLQVWHHAFGKFIDGFGIYRGVLSTIRDAFHKRIGTMDELQRRATEMEAEVARRQLREDAEYRRQARTAGKELDVLDDKAKRLERAYEDSRFDIERYQKQVKADAKRCEQYLKQAEQLRQEKDRLGGNMQGISRVNEELKAKIKLVDGEHSEVQEHMESRIAGLTAEHERLSEEVEKLRQELRKMKDQHNARIGRC